MSIYLACPTARGEYDMATMAAVVNFARQFPEAEIRMKMFSLLPYSFNSLLCDALNRGFKKFFLLHSDVGPQLPEWGAMMLELMAWHKLEAISGMVAIRDETGDSSTAIDTPGGIVRMKMNGLGNMDVLNSKQQPKLLINTGCLLMDLEAREDWPLMPFEFKDTIIRHPHGPYEAKTQPEDWLISRKWHEAGVKFGVINPRLLPIGHAGRKSWGG